MKYLGNMTTMLLVNNGFIEQSEKEGVQQDIQESFSNQENSKNKIVQNINSFFKTPLGVFASLLIYVFVNNQIKASNRKDEQDDFKAEFKMALQQEMLSDFKNEK